MGWLGPLLHLLFPPRVDPVLMEMHAILEGQRTAGAEVAATRARLERIAAEPLDDLAEGL